MKSLFIVQSTYNRWNAVVMVFIIAIFLSGCVEYEYFNLHALKSEFYDVQQVKFVQEQTGLSITLKASSYECNESDREYYKYSSKLKHVYIDELCGQSVKISDDYISMLDHSIRSEARKSGCSIDLFFEKDEFSLPSDTTDTTFHMINVTIDGAEYQSVYVLTNSVGHATYIDSIYYLNGTGLLKVFEKSGIVWKRQ